jgi:hypothetical protein
MARLPWLVIPGLPHHVTQRGNRRARTFFEEGDYALYRDLDYGDSLLITLNAPFMASWRDYPGLSSPVSPIM